MPKNLAELVHLECVFDVLDSYLWLSYRFSEMFPHVDQIRNAQVQLDQLIQDGVLHLTKLLKNVNEENSEIGCEYLLYVVLCLALVYLIEDRCEMINDNYSTSLQLNYHTIWRLEWAKIRQLKIVATYLVH